MASVDYPDWSSLLPELLEQVATGFKIYSDYVRFRAVCNSWRSSTPATPTHLPCQLPLMLFPQGGDDESISIFSVDCNKHHYLRLTEPLHDHPHRRCRGSSHGWLFVAEPIDVYDRSRSPTGWVFLLNPLTGAKLSLPPLLRLIEDEVSSWINAYWTGNRMLHVPINKRDSFIRKFALSDSPSRNPDFTALAILHRSGKLACCKSGQNHWTVVSGVDTRIRDAVYLNGMVYAVDKSDNIVICDVSGDSPQVIGVMAIEESLDGREESCRRSADNYYLVSACDEHELYLVARFVACWTRVFKVYKLNSCGKRWEGVSDLGDLALFVGGNSCSLALTASDFPGCKGNYIYFTGDKFVGRRTVENDVPNEMGIFSLEDETIQRFSGTKCLPCHVGDSRIHPIWITPNPF